MKLYVLPEKLSRPRRIAAWYSPSHGGTGSVGWSPLEKPLILQSNAFMSVSAVSLRSPFTP